MGNGNGRKCGFYFTGVWYKKVDRYRALGGGTFEAIKKRKDSRYRRIMEIRMKATGYDNCTIRLSEWVGKHFLGASIFTSSPMIN